MEKKRLVFVVIILSILLLNLLVKADDLSPVPVNMPGGITPDKIEGYKDKIDNVTSDETRNYLAKEWKNILMKNRFFIIFDRFLTNLSPVFKILMAEPYSFSIQFFLILFLWCYFVLLSIVIINDFTQLKDRLNDPAYLIGPALVILFSHIGMMKYIAAWIDWLVLSQQAGWVRTAIVFAIIGIIVFLYFVISSIGSALKKTQENLKVTDQKTKIKHAADLSRAIIYEGDDSDI